MSTPRVALAGKGGAGKSVIAGTLARLLARRGHRVLALDSDTLPGLAVSLGASVPDEPPLLAAAERDEDGRWRLRPGIGPVRAVQRYATPAPDGVVLLQSGKVRGEEGLAPVLGAVHAFNRVVHRLQEATSLRGWAIVGDLPGGSRQVAFRWAPYAERILLVAEPTWPSLLAARRIARIVAARPEPPVSLVVSKATGPGDVRRVEDALGLRALAAIPLDLAVADAERRGVAVLDTAPDARAVAAIDHLVEALAAATLGA